MKKNHFLTALLLLFVTSTMSAQSVIKEQNIDTLNRIAEVYNNYKWIIGIITPIVVFLGFWGTKSYLKNGIKDWVEDEIAKRAGIKVDDLKAVIAEQANINKLKKKIIWVISADSGQQANVKKVFDNCGFFYDEKTWINIQDAKGLKLSNVDVLLFNDQPQKPLEESQIAEVIASFKKDVAYFYFGDKHIKSVDYRKAYDIEIDFCNSKSRLEDGLLKLLKIL